MYALWVQARDINNQAEADAVLAKCKAVGITDMFFQVMDDLGRVHYNTTLPFTRCPDIGSFDPLAYLAQSGIRAHAWLSVGYDILCAHPEWNVHITQNLPTTYRKWADFTRADVRQFAAEWAASIVKDYPGVGIHLDYLRWDVKFGGDKLPWATADAITQTYRAIAAAVARSTITAAVAYNPLGTDAGSLQAWGKWMDTLDKAIVMAYPSSVSKLRARMAYSAGIDKNKIGVGLSGRNFDVTPDTRIDPAILADCVTWARSAGYQHFSWFDYTKIDAEQYATIAQYSSADSKVEPALLPASPLTLFAVLFFAIAAWRYWATKER